MLEALWICAAFFLGFLARASRSTAADRISCCGFFYSLEGDTPQVQLSTSYLRQVVTLLLFTIGLKLRVKSLLRPYVWAPATLHMLVLSVLLGLALYALPIGVPLAAALLIGFALSYSSTVFAVKVLEDKGEISGIYGQATLGVLIIQDLVAVLFMAISTGTWPKPWALLLLLGIFPLRIILFKVMNRTGHLELLILFGLAAALGAYELFEMVGLKGDLGALVMGVPSIYTSII